MDEKIIWAIVGLSGSGKTSVGAGSFKDRGVPEIISHTTRNMRAGEIEGETYYYVDKETFDKLEKVEEVCYAGNYYCTSKNEIENKLKTNDELVVVVSIEGVEALKHSYGDIVKSVFMDINKDLCISRMIARGDSKDAIEKRKAQSEITNEFDNGKFCDYIYSCPVDISIEDNKRDFQNFIAKIKEEI